MTIEGVDFANARPSGAALRAAGKHFVVRYLSPNTKSNPGKRLTTIEITSYRGAGLDIAVVWETTTTRATEGRTAGVFDAQAAQTQLAALRMPLDMPIYFAIDANVTGESCAPYFAGIASVLGKKRTGAYGGYQQIRYMFDQALITWGWQTYAWSSAILDGQRTTLWDQRAQLQQYRNGATVAGVTLDLCRAMKTDFGQWPADNSNPSVPVEVLNMELTDQLSNGVTVNDALVTVFNRSANLGPWEKQELDGIVATLAGMPAAVVSALPTAGAGAFTPEQIAQVQAAMSAALANVKVNVSTQ